MQERSKDGGKSKIVGNETLHGLIAFYMETLHLTYKEVYEEIPYRNLVMMQRDKLHEAYGDIIRKITSEELANGKIK